MDGLKSVLLKSEFLTFWAGKYTEGTLFCRCRRFRYPFQICPMACIMCNSALKRRGLSNQNSLQVCFGMEVVCPQYHRVDYSTVRVKQTLFFRLLGTKIG